MPKRSGRSWVWVAVALLGLALVGMLLLFTRPEHRLPSAEAAFEPHVTGPARSSASAEPRSSSPTKMPSAAPETAATPERRSGKPISPEVQSLRARVLDSLGNRKLDTTDGVAPDSKSKPPVTEPRPGALKDRTGELNPETMRVLNHEFMPLVRECYDQAHERNPELRGMLAVSIGLAGADELGTIIETVEPAQDINELADDELIECVRQSAFSIQLPMPLKSGRASRQLTMNFGTQN